MLVRAGPFFPIEKESESTFASDFICICLLAFKISEKCEGKKTASLSDMTNVTSKINESARDMFSEQSVTI